jgi:DNA-binding response OmpR family regulator
MPQRIALVDQRPDLLAFLKEKLEDRGYEILTVFTEEEAERIQPKPDLVLVGFEPRVDLAEVVQAIEDGLRPRRGRPRR